ncbi:RNA polymerase sigma-70 factor, ECF subfamily [Parapedobacter indicus]|uniref:RNA polymerase sigma-70 factor, ECF subfamily n=1 Tax=Parapedobacter indicus TaxID=1477437 RepID=A0A1I3H3D3_9SPHI|nr:RNA polymerase sigma-70 factor (ECF subfamily) [Parapedobacter indicus]SFI30186.1 RNA polymerase sigma-70 factor, ECF subfamily [Parapedobacter indicus]
MSDILPLHLCQIAFKRTVRSKPINTEEESKILTRLRCGDEKAFAEVYHTYQNRIGHRLLRLLKSEILAEEVMQDIFLKVWENRTSIDPEQPFKSYLYRIAENRVIDLFRRAKKEQSILEEIIAGNTELYTHIEEALFKKEYASLLDRLIVQMPAQRKKIFIACKLEGKSYQEAADEFGIATTTVNDHLQKAMHYLKSKLVVNHDALMLLTVSLLLQ